MIRMNIKLEDFCHSMILHEVRLCKGLAEDLNIAKTIQKYGPTLLKLMLSSSTPFPVLEKKLIMEAFKDNSSLKLVREARLLYQRLKGTKESSSHSCSRTALCYALIGEFNTAEKWLKEAEKYISDLARPHYIRGLIEGSNGNQASAISHLERALLERANQATKLRINNALSFLKSPEEWIAKYSTPLTIVAHRGAHLRVKKDENTMKAFQKAIDLGCDYIETDVQCTSDKILICYHDKTIDSHLIKDLSFQELLQKTQEKRIELCTFQDYLSLHTKIQLDIEIKGSRYEHLVWEAIKGIPHYRYVIKSFNLDVLRTIRGFSHKIKLGYLLQKEEEIYTLPKELNLSFISPKISTITNSFLGRAQKLKLEVWPWTIKNKEELGHMRFLGISTVVSDIPDVKENFDS